VTSPLTDVAPAFVAIAHRIVWATVATVDPSNRPRGRILHPIWEWDGEQLVGWIATGPTPRKVADLDHSPSVSVTYWDATHDTATAECDARLLYDDDIRQEVWRKFAEGPAPVGYDPAIIPPWRDGPLSPAFAAMRLDPWRLRAMPGTVMLRGQGETLTWRRPA
jgi:hypothetical protein